MKAMPEAYRQADLIITSLSKKILTALNKTKRKLSINGFDELNIETETDALYVLFDSLCRSEYRKLYKARYTELWRWMKDEKPSEDELDDLVEMYLSGLWNEPNENTHYSFQSELIRKRDRAKEAMLSVPTKIQKQLELEKASRYVIHQMAWYADFVSQDAEIQAYKDAGVKKVQRHEMNDEKVCAVCKKADGEIYEINHIPPLPHLRCRRWFSPVNKS